MTQTVTFKETLKILIGEVIVLALMFCVFFLFDRFDLTVVWGGLLGAAANLIYFLMICFSVNSAVREQDEKRQKLSLSISYYLRFAVLGILIAIGLKLDFFNNIAVIIPVFATRPIITVAEGLRKGVKE
ncbi:MAG: ATP synthase subunit I [Clostridia bacterium]|nr:ATP synthase subunit I [Clostridia bacterium]